MKLFENMEDETKGMVLIVAALCAMGMVGFVCGAAIEISKNLRPANPPTAVVPDR
jgi:hypothetical protein